MFFVVLWSQTYHAIVIAIALLRRNLSGHPLKIDGEQRSLKHFSSDCYEQRLKIIIQIDKSFASTSHHRTLERTMKEILLTWRPRHEGWDGKNETIWKIKFHCWICVSSFFSDVFSSSYLGVYLLERGWIASESLLTKLHTILVQRRCYCCCRVWEKNVSVGFIILRVRAFVPQGGGGSVAAYQFIFNFINFNLIFNDSWFFRSADKSVAKIDSINIDTSNGH